MNLQMRIALATQLGEYILSGSPEWLETKHRASLVNPWFTTEFIDIAAGKLANHFLDKQKLGNWASSYKIETVALKRSVS
jgi:hypothetical protein